MNLYKENVAVWGHHKIKGLAKITLGLLFWGYTGATFLSWNQEIKGWGAKTSSG